MERRNINTVGTIFNDFLGLYTGERPVGIRELIQKYDKHPVLMGLLSNVDSIIYVDVKKAMYEIYPLYKKYRHCALDDEAWKAIVESAEALEKKWNGNLWVRRVILNLVNELDKESKELQRAAAGGNAENHGHGCFYSGKKEFSAEGFVNPAICVCNRKADRRNASFAGSWVCDCDWHVSFRPC